MATCEIVTIGDEILIGQIVDTNSAYICNRFNEIGVAISDITSIGDVDKQIELQLNISLQRSDIVIVTGGLGPTKDDITKKTLAKIFNSPLVRDQPTYEHVKALVGMRGFDFNLSNQSQADVPECATVIKNSNGTAPGMLFEADGHCLFSLPGVPFEMEALLEDVIEVIKNRFQLASIVHKTVLSYGMAESVLSETIAPWEDALPDSLHLAYLPNAKGIRLRLSAYDVDRDWAEKQMVKQFDALKNIISENILGYMPTSLEEVVAKMLVDRSQTVAVAESCTGGAIAARITSLSGSSEYFLGSVTSYADEVKVKVLGVNRCDLDKYGAVSEAVVSQMASGVRKLMGAHYAIATSGIAGPGGGSDQKPVGTVWFAVAHKGGVQTMKMAFGKLRQPNIDRATAHALNMLRLTLLQSQN